MVIRKLNDLRRVLAAVLDLKEINRKIDRDGDFCVGSMVFEVVLLGPGEEPLIQELLEIAANDCSTSIVTLLGPGRRSNAVSRARACVAYVLYCKGITMVQVTNSLQLKTHASVFHMLKHFPPRSRLPNRSLQMLYKLAQCHYDASIEREQ